LASRKLEDRIEQLRRLRGEPSGQDLKPALDKAFTDRSNLVVAEAAKAVGQLRLSDCIPDLLNAYDRLFEEAAKTDPKCWGKAAIVQALTDLDYSESRPFVRGLHHVQMEPVWGGQEDSAAHLRANCALALVQCSDLTRLEMLQELVDAMTDAADPVRVEAVRALTQLAGDEAILLLRLKARSGDRRPLIMGHVFDALLTLERERAVSFVAAYLNSNDEPLRDEAALALGASRLSTALKHLMSTWTNMRGDAFARVVLRAISSSRLDEAIAFLLEVLGKGTSRESAAAAEALKLHDDSPEIRGRIEQTLKSRMDD
jgi:HEAT repeat protein